MMTGNGIVRVLIWVDDERSSSLIKSPLNYVGGKYKLLPQILPLFPDRIRTFYDVFGGGAT